MRTLTALVLTALPVSDALAYTPRAWGSCSDIAFDGTPAVVLHYDEAVGIDFVELLQLTAAMDDIHAALDNVGASTAGISSFTAVTDPYVAGDWFGDATPTIHVGFTSDPGAAIGSTQWDVDTGDCTIQEAHITFQDGLLVPWLFNEPTYYGYEYWDVEHEISGTWWYRISYMHELLHAFGLAHSNSSYSMMNYSDRPFANRPTGEQIMPLPDDVEFLRDFYPAGGSRAEVAVLDTWYDPIVSTDTYPAASQYRLCQPAKGSGWAADTTEGLCATAGTIDVCPGDTVRTRFAVANYSTSSADLSARMVLSTDNVLDGADKRSATVRTFTVSAQGSSKQGRGFIVPSTVAYNTDYNVLIRIGGTAGGTSVSDWSPMRGHIHVKARGSCP